MKKPQRKYFIILLLGFIGWLAETAYFGFNKTPENGLEATLDVATALMMVYGVIGDLLQNVRIQKHYKSVTNIQTKKVNFQDEPKIASYNVKMANAPKAKK